MKFSTEIVALAAKTFVADLRDGCDLRSVDGSKFEAGLRALMERYGDALTLFDSTGLAIQDLAIASAARDIGFRFGTLPAGVGKPTTSQQVRYGAATTTFRWRNGPWLVSFDGRAATTTEGPQLGAETVVIQYVKIRSSRFRDSAGNATPYTPSVGSGTALVLRDGVAIPARWSRPDASRGTTFTTSTGAPLPFAPGRVWVAFAPAPGG